MLGLILIHVGVHCGVNCYKFQDHPGFDFDTFRIRVGINFNSFWDTLRDTFGTFWGPLWVPFNIHFGIHLGIPL